MRASSSRTAHGSSSEKSARRASSTGPARRTRTPNPPPPPRRRRSRERACAHAHAHAASVRGAARGSEPFDGRLAFALLRTHVVQYGWRPAGSASLRRLAVRSRGLMPRGRLARPYRGIRGCATSSARSRAGGPRSSSTRTTTSRRRRAASSEPTAAADTAAVVTLARAFARAPRPRDARDLRLVLFDGEEEPAGCEQCGLRGSTA